MFGGIFLDFFTRDFTRFKRFSKFEGMMKDFKELMVLEKIPRNLTRFRNCEGFSKNFVGFEKIAKDFKKLPRVSIRFERL